MAETWRYRGQEIDSEQLAFLREFIRMHPSSSRWKLSRQLCEVLGWKQANGALRDMVCRGMLLMLERAGEIELPPYNTRFLILPWVQVPHLASHILGKVTRGLSGDWERMYGHPVYFAETFIDPGRFRGTCYRAANWQFLGLTTGRGKNNQTNKPNRPIKEILGLPLVPRFRQLLSHI